MTTSGDTALPKSVELMWGLEQPGARGPRRGLTLDQILDAAVAVADAEGYAALSMNRVAKQLGFTAMSLYRYVDSKNTLIDLLMDRVVGEPPAIAADTPWRPGLEQWASAEFERIGRHPWWVDIPLNRPPMGPNNMAWLDAGLRLLGETAVPEPIKLQLVMNLSMFVMGKRRAVRDLQTEEDGDFASVMARVLDPQRFPSVSAALSASAFYDDEIDWDKADFEFGLARLLDGYEVFIRTFD
ncbi:TetR/AcrR family transcriptional regulator [Nocardia rhizosphaerihabitans]|uniref:TetR family transcriptional regulator n=1 Tax=Nocardia rhizosphaerihabitans TaxID=1691570 RepID=A0ABQ2KS19_9NOCA|nr:TetR/AcrR family transcriptional regulator [Nocardia rhizosphaerihabitans]GGN90718.1 TetR family transcriptional regulator [Nocardia rhizosphaerihabitans]